MKVGDLVKSSSSSICGLGVVLTKPEPHTLAEFGLSDETEELVLVRWSNWDDEPEYYACSFLEVVSER